jgi:hypothetical protein
VSSAAVFTASASPSSVNCVFVKEIPMHTIRTHFGGLDTGDSFIYQYHIFKKVSAYLAVNCHTMQTRKFKLDQLIEVTPN